MSVELAQGWHCRMNVAEGGGKARRLVDVFMNHPITKLSHPQPGIGGIEPAVPFSAIEIRHDRLCLLATHPQEQRQHFVAEHVLKSAESCYERLDPFGNHRIQSRRLGNLVGSGRTKETIACRKQIALFRGRSCQ